MDLNISEVSNEHKLFQGWGFDHVHFYGKHFHFLLTFPLLNSESFALFEKEEPNFHICCRKQQRKGKKKLWKKEFVFVKNSSQSFFPSTLFSVFKTNSIKIFEIFLKNKPVSNDIYIEVVELNPSLLYCKLLLTRWCKGFVFECIKNSSKFPPIYFRSFQILSS